MLRKAGGIHANFGYMGCFGKIAAVLRKAAVSGANAGYRGHSEKSLPCCEKQAYLLLI